MWYSHFRNSQGQYRDLLDHLQRVADMSRRFAAPFAAGEVAARLGYGASLAK